MSAEKILQLLQQVDDKLDSSDPHNARSEGNGGIGSNSGYGGSFGNGGGSRADSLQSKQYQPVDQFNGRSDDGSEAAGVRHHLRQVLVQWRRDRKNSAMIRKNNI